MRRDFRQPEAPRRAPWLEDAERLFSMGLMIPDVAVALSQLGYSDIMVAFATAAMTSDAVRAARERQVQEPIRAGPVRISPFG